MKKPKTIHVTKHVFHDGHVLIDESERCRGEIFWSNSKISLSFNNHLELLLIMAMACRPGTCPTIQSLVADVAEVILARSDKS